MYNPGYDLEYFIAIASKNLLSICLLMHIELFEKIIIVIVKMYVDMT